ncbi:putative biofilm formation methyltransferase WspC [Paraburkholderia caffeinitolerans]|uniref:Putative biofilm formation methyltransferase WspC n=1 Tax=Paraburkholderia caffeinitolerans TaxID=1723730 RepID=A0A6J5GLD3_9BURK|nr:CheR family methyltransferase [Paraburkholderia caffeinitolerans]CAB3802450.1 putative biofilm formation methyltransferase WspC [Paraburkholderia caffeinitolerans]
MMSAQPHVDPRFVTWLAQETGIDAESLGAHALARAVAARAALTVAGGDHGGTTVPHGASASRALPAHWDRGAVLPEAVSDAYWARLTTDVAERQTLIDALVVPETWFFREREAFAALARGGVQRLAAEPGELVRVLSVPCSTGEEPYSAAMALMDAGLAHEQFGIDAIDISATSIEAATRGVYGRNAFRGDAPALREFRERYFHAAPDGWQLGDAVRRAVSFERANLFDWLAAHPVRYDFIFCRNVLIYFDREAQDRAIGLLRARLAVGGMIFVGPAETGLMMRHEWISAQIPLAFGFVAPGEGAARRGHVSDDLRIARAAAPAALPDPAVQALPLARRSPPVALSARAGSAAGVVAGKAFSVASAAGALSTPSAVQANGASAAPRVATSGVAMPGVATLASARRLADSGALDEAARAAAQVAQASPQDAEAWYLLGVIADAQGRPALALEHYRKALYLEPGHYEALTHLAALLEVQGDAQGARRLMRRAERAAPNLSRRPGHGGADA